MPFRVDVDLEDGYMASGGIDDFNGQMEPGTCGHAKVCPITGELHGFIARCRPTSYFPLLPLAAVLWCCVTGTLCYRPDTDICMCVQASKANRGPGASRVPSGVC